MTTIKEIKNFLDKGRKIQKDIDKELQNARIIEAHSITPGANDLHWVFCPKENETIPLAKRPNFCPMCGDDIK
jgi:hypothetical protein